MTHTLIFFPGSTAPEPHSKINPRSSSTVPSDSWQCLPDRSEFKQDPSLYPNLFKISSKIFFDSFKYQPNPSPAEKTSKNHHKDHLYVHHKPLWYHLYATMNDIHISTVKCLLCIIIMIKFCNKRKLKKVLGKNLIRHHK